MAIEKHVQHVQFLRNSGITNVTDAKTALSNKVGEIQTGDTDYDGSIILGRDKSGHTVAAIMTVKGDVAKATYVVGQEELDAAIKNISATTSGNVNDLQTKINTVSGTADANKASIEKLNGSDATDGSVKKTVKDAIGALDVASIGGSGKVITTVSETDGKISATAIDLAASNVAFAPTSNVEGAVDVSGNTVTAAVASLAKSINDVKSSAATYKIKKIESGLSENVKEAYQLVQTINGNESSIDVQIPIYKDQTLKSVELTDTNAENKSGQYLKYTYIIENGTENVVYVDCSKFLVESEFGNGLNVDDSGKVSVKVGNGSEFLTVTSDGVIVSGVSSAIDSKISGISGTTTIPSGKVITKVSQSNGKVSVETDNLAANYVTSSAITATTAVSVPSTNVQGAISDLATAIKTVESNAISVSAGDGITVTENGTAKTVAAKVKADDAIKIDDGGIYLDLSNVTIDCGEY